LGCFVHFIPSSLLPSFTLRPFFTTFYPPLFLLFIPPPACGALSHSHAWLLCASCVGCQERYVCGVPRGLPSLFILYFLPRFASCKLSLSSPTLISAIFFSFTFLLNFAFRLSHTQHRRPNTNPLSVPFQSIPLPSSVYRAFSPFTSGTYIPGRGFPSCLWGLTPRHTYRVCCFSPFLFWKTD
jgi:hypothetical protein